MTQVWESENDNILVKLAKKHHKDWNYISEAFSDHYQLNYKPDFLRARYNQLIKQEITANNTRKNLQNFEVFEEKKDDYFYDGTKKMKSEANSNPEIDPFEPNPYE